MSTAALARPLRTLIFIALASGLAAACGGDDDAKTGAEEPADCDGARPWPDGSDKTSGLTKCANGVVHRRSAPACTAAKAPELPADDPAALQCAGVECVKDGNVGFCVATLREPPEPNVTACVYPCETDDDCGDGSACFCGPTGGQCITASCRADAECEDGPCIFMYGTLDCGVPSTPTLTCFTESRECAADDACSSDSFCIDGSCRPKANTCG